MPSVGEGYQAARNVAIQAAQLVLSQTYAAEMPETYEEAIQLLQAGWKASRAARRRR